MHPRYIENRHFTYTPVDFRDAFLLDYFKAYWLFNFISKALQGTDKISGEQMAEEFLNGFLIAKYLEYIFIFCD